MVTTQWPTLYGQTSTGKVKVWNIQVKWETFSSPATIEITHGQEGGRQQSTSRTLTEGKNHGRANATTPAKQAEMEAEALWTKKKDKGYHEDRAALSVQEEDTRLPMLALKYEDRKHDVEWPAYVQPKLNGVRCLIERVGGTIIFHSRGAKQFTTLSHLVPDCLAVMKDGDMLDGELYNHGEITFQELVSLIKNGKNTDPARVARYVKFWNYDRVVDAPFYMRSASLTAQGSIVLVPTYPVTGEHEMRKYHGMFVQQGFEGTMVRSGGAEPYRLKYRSPSLLKVKDFQTEEFLIVGAEEGAGKSEGQAVFVCQTSNGKKFGCRCKGTDDSRREQWSNRNEYINKKVLTVKFQSWSDEGIPVFPVGECIRDYE